MKKIFFLILILFSVQSAFSQETEKQPAVVITIPEMGNKVKLPDSLPQTAEEYYDYADKLWRKTLGDDDAKVLEYLNKAIELKPDYSEAYYFRGFVNNRTERYKEAVADLTRNLELDPEDNRSYQLRADTKIKLKDFKGALADYDEFVLRYAAKGKYTTGSLRSRGKLRYFLGDYEGAKQDFGKVVASPNGDIDARFLRAVVYLKQGDKISALEDFKATAEYLDRIFEESVKKYPDQYSEKEGYPASGNPLAVLNKNKADSGTHLEDEVSAGIASIGIATSLNPKRVRKSPEYPTFEEKLVLDNWFDFNSTKFYSTLLISDESSVIYYHYGRLLIEQNKFEAAETAFTKALSYNYEGYKNYDAWFQRGKIRLANKKYELAIRDFSWAMSVNKYFPESYLRRGIAIFMLGHDQIAQKDFDTYLALNPEGKQILQTEIEKAKKLRTEANKK